MPGGGLRRDVDLGGGSGRLYGAQEGVVVAGSAVVISWVIGAVAIALLALVHAELGGMFPAAGGTARSPHDAFGGLAGMPFGWFSWLRLLGGYARYAHAKGLPDAPRLDWKSARWLPVCLVGLGLISWQGGFGGGSGRIRLWWDILLIAAFSPAIYYRARATASPAAEIGRSIEVVVTDAPPH